MIIFKKASQLTDYLIQTRKEQKKIGFVPTMGALHKGHLALIANAVKENDLVVCSIFINPTQFNNPDDLKHYPVTIEQDIEQLVFAHCSVLFLPDEAEIYPASYKPGHYSLGQLEEIFEGRYRPGHFQGVCQVMDRLLHIVDPDNLYMGQKDFQQCMVVKKLLQLIKKQDDITLHIVPTVREGSGLAMSSRNLRLSKEEQTLAASIYEELYRIKSNLNTQSFQELARRGRENLSAKGFSVDYVAIVNRNTLEAPENSGEPVVALVAAAIGPIRLIDNLLLN